MLNLLGCSKENFKKLIQKMNYRVTEKKKIYFLNTSLKKKKNQLIKIIKENHLVY